MARGGGAKVAGQAPVTKATVAVVEKKRSEMEAELETIGNAKIAEVVARMKQVLDTKRMPNAYKWSIAAGLSRDTVRKIMKGDGNVGVATVRRLEHAANLEPGWLLIGDRAMHGEIPPRLKTVSERGKWNKEWELLIWIKCRQRSDVLQMTEDDWIGEMRKLQDESMTFLAMMAASSPKLLPP